MRQFLLTIFLLTLTIQVFSARTECSESDSLASKEKPVKKAVVLYGEATLFNSIESLTDERIQEYYDSIKKLPNPPEELLGQIGMFMSIKTLTKMELAFMLDSLFEAGDQHYALINQINIFIESHDFNAPSEFEYTKENQEYPAHNFYGIWNTTKPHPYPTSLWEKDSSNRLLLTSKDLGEYVSPVGKIVITSTYGHRWNRSHRGIDLDLQVWDPVKSAFKGKVRYVGFYGGYGRVIVVRHHNGLETLYAHLHRYKVAIGDDVEAGEVIGLGGSSGQSTGSHLHFECRFKGVAFDPAQIIDFKEKELVDAQITLVKTKWGFAAIPDGVTYYTVKSGDYLYGIAEKFGTDCTQICNLNNINRNSTLRVGQKLRIL
ncbi:MAG: peptidoglycan DD-metalloendopeptidase family protein [Salibacteraceae bacterium]